MGTLGMVRRRRVSMTAMNPTITSEAMTRTARVPMSDMALDYRWAPRGNLGAFPADSVPGAGRATDMTDDETPGIGPDDPEIPATPPPAGASDPEVEDQPLGTDPDERPADAELPGIPEGEPPASE